jgi:hypothetical protein
VVPVLVLSACSGASDMLRGGALGGGGDDGGSTDDAAGDGDDGSYEASDLTSDSGSSSGGPDAPWDAPCPDISGLYDQLAWSGAGCGVDNAATTVCITGAQPLCAFELASAQGVSTPDASKLTVSGFVELQSDGSFSVAALQFGSVPRTDCTGQWDAGGQTLTIECGGMDSDQSCVVTMTRSGSCQ